MLSTDLSKKYLIILLTILVALTALTYYHRIPGGDDAWFGEQSYLLQKEGVIRSNLFEGLSGLGWEKQLFVSHKLFIVVGAGFIQLFGYHLPTLQFVGLFFFCLFIGQLSLYIYRREGRFDSAYLLAILILIFANRILIKGSFDNRPELMLAVLGFGSFLCLQSSRPSVLKAAIAGVLAGAAMLAHLNGVIYLMAGLATLIYLRQYKLAVVFALVGGVTGLAYFIDIIQAPNGFSVWWYQFRHDPATQRAFGLNSKLLVMLMYPRLFILTLNHTVLSLLLIHLLWHQRKRINQLPSYLKIYSIFLFLAFWLITKKNSGIYITLFMPFILAIIYEAYRLKPFVNLTLKLILIPYFIINIYEIAEMISQNLSVDYLPDSYQALRSHIPADKKGLVPITFFFNEYEHYPRLLCIDNYKNDVHETNMTPGQMANWANKRGVGFILMDYKLIKEPAFPKPGTATIPFYKLAFFDGRFAVYTH